MLITKTINENEIIDILESAEKLKCKRILDASSQPLHEFNVTCADAYAEAYGELKTALGSIGLTHKNFNRLIGNKELRKDEK